MGVRFTYGQGAALPPGEQALHGQRRFRAVSSQSPPSYQVGIQMPPLCLMTLHVTNRRLILANCFMLGLTWELHLWYEGLNPEDDPEVVTGVSVGRGFLGEYLEIRSHDPRHKETWYRSEDLTLRFYFKNPGKVAAIIEQAMGTSTATTPATA